jgi:hypothetical protein
MYLQRNLRLDVLQCVRQAQGSLVTNLRGGRGRETYLNGDLESLDFWALLN